MLALYAVLGYTLVACNRSTIGRDSQVVELSRVTSPNGLLDAVLVQNFYGGAIGGGVESDVYIVRKTVPLRIDKARKVLQADPFSGGQLVWKQDHLLEIHYHVARIEQFRNVWGLWEIENVGSHGERNYDVEIRLVPSNDFSILTPEGSFRRGH